MRLEQVLQRYRQANSNEAKRDVFIQVNIHTIFDEVISSYGVSPDSSKVMALMICCHPKQKR